MRRRCRYDSKHIPASRTNGRTHARTHARTHTQTYARTPARTPARTCGNIPSAMSRNAWRTFLLHMYGTHIHTASWRRHTCELWQSPKSKISQDLQHEYTRGVYMSKRISTQTSKDISTEDVDGAGSCDMLVITGILTQIVQICTDFQRSANHHLYRLVYRHVCRHVYKRVHGHVCIRSKKRVAMSMQMCIHVCT